MLEGDSSPESSGHRGLNVWEVGQRCNTTHIAVVLCHHDVTLHPPSGAPAVFHQPIGLPVQFAVTNRKNAVVEEFA